jgi:hypothetical protein
MIVNIEENTEIGTFAFKSGGGKVHLRLLSGEDIRAMRKACLSSVPEYPLLDGKYQRFEAQNFDSDRWDLMLWGKVITGWEDLYDRSGTPIPVTDENKLLLMNRVPEFRETVEAGMVALKEAEKAKAEQVEKNLLPGLSSPN